jgi:hypothetical protein
MSAGRLLLGDRDLLMPGRRRTRQAAGEHSVGDDSKGIHIPGSAVAGENAIGILNLIRAKVDIVIRQLRW